MEPVLNSPPALDRGLRIIEILAECGGEIGFNDLRQRVGIPNNTLSRLLRLLVHRGYAVKDPGTGKYRPGPRMSVIGQNLPLLERLRRACEATLKQLSIRAGNTVLVIYWNGQQMQCIAKETHELSMAMQDVGCITVNYTERPWGWIFWEQMPPRERRNWLLRAGNAKGLAKQMERQLAEYHERGFAFEDDPNFRRLSAPILDDLNRVIAAVGMGGNSVTIPDSRVVELGGMVAEHARELSRRMGWVQRQTLA
ncbi:MAG TPA: helix-turn-helix domain-containing protein [Planctomycetota bacterium]|nr:helix-turn-helix domain-containing protein [Planctomycetota bacterium]